MTLTSAIALSLFIAAYIRFLLLPIAQETRALINLRRRSLRLSHQIELGTIRLDSPEYWQLVEDLRGCNKVNRSTLDRW